MKPSQHTSPVLRAAARRLLAAVLLTMVSWGGSVMFFPATRAHAHAQIVRTEPADLSQLSTSPRSMRFFFTEPIDKNETSVALVDTSNRSIGGVGPVMLVEPAAGASNAKEFSASVSLPPLTDGVYLLTWRTVALDGHLSRGTVVFGVGDVRVESGRSEDGPIAIADSARRFFMVVPIALGLGVGLVLFLRKRRAVAGLVLAFSLVGSAVYARTPHTVRGVPGPRGLAFLLQFVHISSAATWAGGCIVLTCLWLRDRKRADRRPIARMLLKQFARPAIWSLGLAVVSGLLLVPQAVVSIDALLLSTYGRILLAKVVFVMLAMRFGLRNAAALGHSEAVSFSEGRLRPVVRGRRGASTDTSLRLFGQLNTQAGLLVVVIASAALLAGSPLATGGQWIRTRRIASAQPTISADVSDLVSTLTIKPNRPGANFVDVGVFDTRVPAPVAEKTIRVSLQRPNNGETTEQIAVDAGDGYYRLENTNFDVAGEWTVGITIERAGLASESVSFPWVVADGLGAGRRSTLLSQQALRPLTWLLAGVVGVTSIGAYRRGRRRLKRTNATGVARPTPPGERIPVDGDRRD